MGDDNVEDATCTSCVWLVAAWWFAGSVTHSVSVTHSLSPSS